MIYKVTWAFKRTIKNNWVAYVEAASEMDARMQLQDQQTDSMPAKGHQSHFPLDKKTCIIKGIKNVKAG